MGMRICHRRSGQFLGVITDLRAVLVEYNFGPRGRGIGSYDEIVPTDPIEIRNTTPCVACEENDDEQCSRPHRACGHHCDCTWHDGGEDATAICCWCGRSLDWDENA